MRVVLSALVIVALALIIGCDNDENTVNSIPKFHYVYPVFHLKIDNTHRTFGIDSVLLTTTPGVGWPGPVYSDKDGFIGASASGTFITSIDTIDQGGEMVVETTYTVYGFSPSQTYNFSFGRPEPFMWLDSFRIDYAISVDSQWVLFSADTSLLSRVADPNQPPARVLDRVRKNFPPTISPSPDSIYYEKSLYGRWNYGEGIDSTFVITNPDDTLGFPPDTAYIDSVKWGFWFRTDSFFLPSDSATWCRESLAVRERIIYDIHGYPMTVIDTVSIYKDCSPYIDSTKIRMYKHWGWGSYPGGDPTQPPLSSFDTTTHFTFPDTAKGLIIDPSGLSVYTWEVLPDSSDTISDTTAVDIYLIRNGDTTMLNNLSVDLTMPPVEVYPSYRFIVKQRP